MRNSLLLLLFLHPLSAFSLLVPTEEKCYHGFFLENSKSSANKCSIGFSWTVKATHRVETMDLRNGRIGWSCNPETAWGDVLKDYALLSQVPPIESLTVGPIVPGEAVELYDNREERLRADGNVTTTVPPAPRPHCRWKRVQRGKKIITCFCFAENCADVAENNIMEIFEESCNQPGEDKDARCPADHYRDRDCFEAEIKRALQKATETEATTDSGGSTTSSFSPDDEMTTILEEEEMSQEDAENTLGTAFVLKISIGTAAVLLVIAGIAAFFALKAKKNSKKANLSSETSRI